MRFILSGFTVTVMMICCRLDHVYAMDCCLLRLFAQLVYSFVWCLQYRFRRFGGGPGLGYGYVVAVDLRQFCLRMDMIAVCAHAC